MFDDTEISRLCYKSYEDFYSITGKFEDSGLICIDNTEIYWFASKKEILFVFRGTELTLGDICRNLKIKYKTSYGLHEGYLNDYMKCSRRINDIIDMHYDKNVVLAGHSAGGAMAMCAAIYIKPFKLVTFGQPRTALNQINSYINNLNYRRYVNESDIIPWMPLPLNYKHHGELRFINSNKITINPNIIRMTIRRLFVIPQLLHNHKSETYYQNMLKILP